jgi:hypothetical protein
MILQGYVSIYYAQIHYLATETLGSYFANGEMLAKISIYHNRAETLFAHHDYLDNNSPYQIAW